MAVMLVSIPEGSLDHPHADSEERVVMNAGAERKEA
jgi:hypothetical protein